MQNQDFILLGQVSGKLDSVLSKQAEQTGHISQLFRGIAEIKENLNRLPCTEHSEKLKGILSREDLYNKDEKLLANEKKLEGVKAGLSLKTGLLLLAASGAGSIITGVIVYWLTCGVK